MPITEVQRNSGGFTGTSGNATLGAATTAGNTLVLCVGCSSSINTPSGFTKDTSVSSNSAHIFRKTAVGGETSWSITAASSRDIVWDIFELEGVDNAAPVDASASTAGTGGSSGTTAASTTYDGLAIAVLSATVSSGGTIHTWSGHTNGFEEQNDHGQSSGTTAVGTSVAWRPVQSLGTWETTGTATGGSILQGVIVVYTAAGARKDANLAHFWAFKVGAGAAGLGTGTAGARYFETVVGSPAITADGLQVSASAAAESVASALLAVGSQNLVKAAVARVRFRFDSALPGADLELANITPNSTGSLTLRYVSASQKLGVKIGTGTEQLSAATVTADSWITVEVRLIGTSAAHTCDWRVDDGSGPVDQTQASFTAGGGFTAWTPRLGWSAASTGTVTYAYAVFSVISGHYPLGEYIFALLVPSGAPTVSGTVGNFAFITANATGTALASGTLANVPATIDDFPPTVGGSADGFCAITASASDYLEQPLSTYDASGTGSIRAARVVIPMWAASGTAATCRVSGYDGTTATTLFAEADPATDNSSTPGWVCAMWRPTGGWTQAKLNAAAIRYGSNDANPRIGPHSVGMEVAVQTATTSTLFGELASQALDPVSGGILAVEVTNPADKASSLHYEEGGTPTDVTVGVGATHDEPIDAPDAPTVNYVALYPDPEPLPPPEPEPA